MNQTIEPASAAIPEKKPPRIALLIATGFGLGYLPKAPGTWGSLLGLILVALIWLIPMLLLIAFFDWKAHLGIGFELPRIFGVPVHPAFPIHALSLVISGYVGVVVSARAASYFDKIDPQQVVIDEISGQQVALLGASIGMSGSYPQFMSFPFELTGWKYLLAGFILFRVFDIWKPFGVKQAEKLPGGWGIMADDWVAGIYAAICLWGMRAAGF